MRVLVVSDLHGDLDSARRACDRVKPRADPLVRRLGRSVGGGRGRVRGPARHRTGLYDLRQSRSHGTAGPPAEPRWFAGLAPAGGAIRGDGPEPGRDRRDLGEVARQAALRHRRRRGRGRGPDRPLGPGGHPPHPRLPGRAGRPDPDAAGTAASAASSRPTRPSHPACTSAATCTWRRNARSRTGGGSSTSAPRPRDRSSSSSSTRSGGDSRPGWRRCRSLDANPPFKIDTDMPLPLPRGSGPESGVVAPTPLGRHVPRLQKDVLRYSRVEIHRSARRHGIRDADIQHAVDHPVVVVDLDTESDPPKVLTIGPDRAGNLLEVILLDLAADELHNSRDAATPCVL